MLIGHPGSDMLSCRAPTLNLGGQGGRIWVGLFFFHWHVVLGCLTTPSGYSLNHPSALTERENGNRARDTRRSVTCGWAYFLFHLPLGLV